MDGKDKNERRHESFAFVIIRKLVIAFAFIVGVSARAHGPNPPASLNGLAIILIDMQDGFFIKRPDNQEYLRSQRELIQTQLRLLQWAKRHAVPVLVFEYEDFGSTTSALKRAVEDLGPGRYYFMAKSKDGGFDNWRLPFTTPRSILKRWGAKNLIVTGINGPYCVQQTVRGALEKGFNVMTSPDLIGNFSPYRPDYPDCHWDHDLDPSPSWLQLFNGQRNKLINFSNHFSILSCERLLNGNHSPEPL